MLAQRLRPEIQLLMGIDQVIIAVRYHFHLPFQRVVSHFVQVMSVNISCKHGRYVSVFLTGSKAGIGLEPVEECIIRSSSRGYW